MDTLIENLVAIEAEAQDAMHVIEKETAQLAQKAKDALNEKISKIEQYSEESIRRLIQETDQNTADKIAAIQAEYDHKWEAFESEFNSGKDELRAKMVHDVLYGGQRL